MAPQILFLVFLQRKAFSECSIKAASVELDSIDKCLGTFVYSPVATLHECPVTDRFDLDTISQVLDAHFTRDLHSHNSTAQRTGCLCVSLALSYSSRLQLRGEPTFALPSLAALQPTGSLNWQGALATEFLEVPGTQETMYVLLHVIYKRLAQLKPAQALFPSRLCCYRFQPRNVCALSFAFQNSSYRPSHQFS